MKDHQKTIDDAISTLLTAGMYFDSDPAHWIKYTTSGINRKTPEVYEPAATEKATCFCMLGALEAFSPDKSTKDVADRALRRVIVQKYDQFSVATVNDKYLRNGKQAASLMFKTAQLLEKKPYLFQ